jgi:hypothetical protein
LTTFVVKSKKTGTFIFSRPAAAMGLEPFLVLVTCRDEGQQVELLRRLRGAGMECRALMG